MREGRVGERSGAGASPSWKTCDCDRGRLVRVLVHPLRPAGSALVPEECLAYYLRSLAVCPVVRLLSVSMTVTQYCSFSGLLRDSTEDDDDEEARERIRRPVGAVRTLYSVGTWPNSDFFGTVLPVVCLTVLYLPLHQRSSQLGAPARQANLVETL